MSATKRTRAEEAEWRDEYARDPEAAEALWRWGLSVTIRRDDPINAPNENSASTIATVKGLRKSTRPRAQKMPKAPVRGEEDAQQFKCLYQKELRQLPPEHEERLDDEERADLDRVRRVRVEPSSFATDAIGANGREVFDARATLDDPEDEDETTALVRAGLAAPGATFEIEKRDKAGRNKGYRKVTRKYRGAGRAIELVSLEETLADSGRTVEEFQAESGHYITRNHPALAATAIRRGKPTRAPKKKAANDL